jgi:predicted enzyme related to lactoylglutathione lyase
MEQVGKAAEDAKKALESVTSGGGDVGKALEIITSGGGSDICKDAGSAIKGLLGK